MNKKQEMNESSQRKYILYVDKNYSYEDIGYGRDVYIRRELAKRYDLKIYRNLDYKILEFIRQALSERKIDAVITNMPHNQARYCPIELINVQNSYKNSLDILQEIKKITDIPIVIYTGAGNSLAVITAFSKVGDHIVFKSTSSLEDLQRINKALERLFPKYENMPFQIKDPVIKTKNGYTTVPVRVNLNEGLNMMSLVLICKECKTYTGEILFRTSGEDKHTKKVYNGKRFFDLIPPPLIEEGQNLIICVEGVGEEALKMARRLFNAFSSRYWFTMNLKF